MSGIIFINGVGHSANMVAMTHGLSEQTVKNRYNSGKRGYDLIAPPGKQPINVMIDGEQVSLRALAKQTGIKLSTLRQRYYSDKRGDDLTAPVVDNPTVEYEGEQVSLHKLAKVTGINYQTVITRYNSGKRGDDLTQSPHACRPGITVEYEGEQVSLHKLSGRIGINYQTLLQRYRAGKRGVDLTRAVGGIDPNLIDYEGSHVTPEHFAILTTANHLTTIAAFTGIDSGTLSHRYAAGLRGKDLTAPINYEVDGCDLTVDQIEFIYRG